MVMTRYGGSGAFPYIKPENKIETEIVEISKKEVKDEKSIIDTDVIDVKKEVIDEKPSKTKTRRTPARKKAAQKKEVNENE